MYLLTKVRNILNRFRRPAAVVHAQREAVRRSPQCAACGSLSGLQGHHIQPFKKFPELAAQASNFIVLCEDLGGLECHLAIGHGGNFKFYNPNVVRDAWDYRQANDIKRRVMLDSIRASRLVDG